MEQRHFWEDWPLSAWLALAGTLLIVDSWVLGAVWAAAPRTQDRPHAEYVLWLGLAGLALLPVARCVSGAEERAEREP